jgi:iron(III) transport system substrate-binding protein
MNKRAPVATAAAALLLFSMKAPAAWAAAAPSKPAWQTEWERTLKAAKEEGQVTIYIDSSATLLLEPFKKRFPEIHAVSINIDSPQLANRVMAERRAGKYLVDVVITGANPNYQVYYAAKILDPITTAFILPEVTDESKWLQGKHWYIDNENRYVFVYLGNVARAGSYNSKLVSPAQFKSYWDLLKPEWKGKIVARDIRRPGSGGDAMRFFYHAPELGPTFIRRLFSETGLTLTADNRQGVDWLGQGKFALGLFFGRIELAKAQGLPVDELDPHLFKEGAPLGIGPGTAVLINRAPHPNAAKVFLNWFLSRDGQLTYQREAARGGTGADSMRTDISKDDVTPAYRRRPDGRYVFVATPDRTDMLPIYKVVNEALAERK